MKKGKALMRRIGMLTSGGDCQSVKCDDARRGKVAVQDVRMT